MSHTPKTAQRPTDRGLRKGRSILHRLTGFLRRQDGTISTEAVIVTPLMIWAILFGYVYSDTMRVKSRTTKAAFTVADALSREASVNQNYIDRMAELTWLLTGGRFESSVRISVIRYDADAGYELSWSKAVGNDLSPYSQGDIDTIQGDLPLAAPMDSIILVDTNVPFTPIYQIGVTDMDLKSSAMTRPRYSPGLCWESSQDC